MRTTLNEIRAFHPCSEGWTKLLRHLKKSIADDEPLAIATIVESNGLDDALWCLRAVKGRDKEIRLFAVLCARQVQHLMTDPRSVNALNVAERYARGKATDSELAAAEAAAWDAAWASAWALEESAAWNAAQAAAWASAESAAWDAARAAAWDAARDVQKRELLRACAEIEAISNIKE